MASKPLRERIVDQFSYQGEHADVWKGFDLLLETEEFLNLGYSKPYRPQFLGSSQRRLATEIGAGLADRFPSVERGPLLDVGCGRGGPSIRLAEALEVAVFGVDLVPYNVMTARANARDRSLPIEFVVGDATRLPCTAYVRDVYGDRLARLRPGKAGCVRRTRARGSQRRRARDLRSARSEPGDGRRGGRRQRIRRVVGHGTTHYDRSAPQGDRERWVRNRGGTGHHPQQRRTLSEVDHAVSRPRRPLR